MYILFDVLSRTVYSLRIFQGILYHKLWKFICFHRSYPKQIEDCCKLNEMSSSEFSGGLLALKHLFKNSNIIFISFLKSQGFEMVNVKVVSSTNKISSDFPLIITDKSFIWCRKSKGPKIQITVSFLHFIHFSVLKFRVNISHVDFI